MITFSVVYFHKRITYWSAMHGNYGNFEIVYQLGLILILWKPSKLALCRSLEQTMNKF